MDIRLAILARGRAFLWKKVALQRPLFSAGFVCTAVDYASKVTGDMISRCLPVFHLQVQTEIICPSKKTRRMRRR
ncbi:hypothetical protein H4W29_004381 [Rhizobium viscosum]|uniref:Uncharacterized protein n=1 Tax=Rhizobium viscosum TaxID=1673 RepID=A0ABR9IVC0_RHIVS|nr:hypothetical protein [Rhizobium viscosum]